MWVFKRAYRDHNGVTGGSGLEQTYIASYDFGTSGVKAVLVDEKGGVFACATAYYPLLTPRAGWAEQDPDAYWNAVCCATRETVEKTGIALRQVAGLVFGTMWRGIIPLDETGNVLHNCIIWLDGRAGKQARNLNARMGTDRFCAQDYWPKLMWLKEERPDIYERASHILENNAYLKYRATGKMAVDLSNSFSSSMKPELHQEYTEIMRAAQLDTAKFPPCVLPWESIGGLTQKAAGELGLEAGTPVFGGCGDIPAIAIGSGSTVMGTAHLYLGSSGWLGVTVPERRENTGEAYQSLDNDKEIMLYTLQSACMSFDWAIELFYQTEKARLGDGIYALVNNEMQNVPPGSGGMIAAPWLHGERPPLSEAARAVFFNMSAHHRRQHCINAVLEGVCFMLRWKIEAYRTETGKDIKALRIAGGGTQSSHWMRMMANVLQLPVEIPLNARHAGAIGTAYCAMIGLGMCESFEDANGMIEIESVYQPDARYADRYDKQFAVFAGLYSALDGSFHKLNQ
jgi:xylulokinase